MAFCVEPIHVVEGDCGYQLENEVIVTRDGSKKITGTKHDYTRLSVISS
ncbi:hypothetical protein SDC9_162928 [bioreactor metagenome]|uniref:Peptidase M24 domain-containing protein n=1 Tax=bioreactor metagenome TaxID=1076179 RepID=A0A645FUB4_9ZZZZ